MNVCDRLLKSLEEFLDNVEIDDWNTSGNNSVHNFLQETFALQVQDINSSSLSGQTFYVDLGSVEEARNVTKDIEDGDLITLESLMNNTTAAISISKDLLEYCTRERMLSSSQTVRLTFSVFLFDTFFHSQDPNTTVGSLIVSARLKCNVTHPPVKSKFLPIKEVRFI